MAMDLLAIESFSWTPHLETAADICAKQAQAGHSVGFAFVDVDNPDEDTERSALRFLGCRPANKVAHLTRLLEPLGVTRVGSPMLAPAAYMEVARFANPRIASVDELRRLSYKGAHLGLGVASSLVSYTEQSSPDIARSRKLVERYLLASALVFEAAHYLIKQWRPRSILVFNGRFACSKPITEAARQLGVGCLFYERGATFQHYSIQHRPIHDRSYRRECIAVAWDNAPVGRENIGRSFFTRRRRGDGIGWVSYTGNQTSGLVPPRRRTRRLVYFASSDYEFAEVDDTIRHTCCSSQSDAIERLVEWTRSHADTELIIRLHPRMHRISRRERRFWRQLNSANVFVDAPLSETDSYALAESADVVLTYGSTMGVEAAFLGKTVIALCDCDYTGFDCVYEPATVGELSDLLGQTQLPPKASERCLPFGYYFLTFGTLYRFYQPTSLFEGTFMGAKLTRDSEFVRRIRASGVGTTVARLRAIARRLRWLGRAPSSRAFSRRFKHLLVAGLLAETQE